MLTYNIFHHRHAVRRWTELTSPRLSPTSDLGLPRNSVLHYLPKDEVEMGISPDDPILSKVERSVFVDHATDLLVKEGNPRSNRMAADTEIRKYHRRYRKFRRLKKLETALRDSQTLLIENYSVLGHLYRYTPSFYSRYYRWFNIQATMWSTINELANQSDRQHFIQFSLPKRLPTLSELLRAEKKITKNSLESFKGPLSLSILDLWLWLGENRTSSTISNVEHKNLNKVNLIWFESGKWFFINLGELNEYRKPTDEELEAGIETNKGKDQLLVQKCTLKSLMTLMEARTVAGVDDFVEERSEEDDSDNYDDEPKAGVKDDNGDEVEEHNLEPEVPREEGDEERIDREITEELDELEKFTESKMDTEPDPSESFNDFTYPEPETFLKDSIDYLADSGLLSGAEYRRLDKLSKKYKELDNPFGEGKLTEFANIDPELLKIDDAPKIGDIETVLDKSMLKSTLMDFDPKYIKEIMPRDIANSVINIQKAGVMVTGYDVEEVNDAINHYQAHTIKLVPVVGTPSTVRFRLPVVDEDGTYVANGVRYRLRKQRADVPIRKTGPSRVALTSYYGKVFVERTDRSTNNYDKWLGNRIVSMGTDDENETVTDLKLTKSFDHNQKLPRLYSALSKRLKGFKANGIEFYLDYKTRESYFGEEAVVEAESDDLTVIGRKGKTLVVVDDNNTLYTAGKGDPVVLGKIDDIIEDLGEAPLEMAEIKLFSKSIPMGLALGYLLGVETLINRLNLEPRRVPTGERLNLAKDEFAVRFADESLVFSKDDQLSTMIMSGFLRFQKDVKDYSLHEYNRKDVYMNVLENNGLQIRYLKELDLLDKLFVDPITKELLEEIREPVNFLGLLFRSCELLLTDWHPLEIDMDYQRIRGYERMAGTVYSELVRAMRIHNGKPASSRNKVDVNPQAVWQQILQDPGQILVEESNPVHNLKEKESVTFTGGGGRSTRSMVARTRIYNERDMGVISEGTVDSGEVAITTFLTPDANFTSLRGITRAYKPDEDGPSKLLSTSALLAPAADRDDPKRVNFIGIQQSQGISAEGYVPSPIRTGYEQVLPHRTDDLFAYTAKQEGQVTEVTDSTITVEYKDGSLYTIEIGRRFGVVAGMTVPHSVVTNLKAGDKFNEGDIITYNENFFTPDTFNPNRVLWKAGVLAKTAIFESSDTLEDSSAISDKTAKELTTVMTKVRSIQLKFDQTVRNLVKSGTEVDVESILCNIEDPVTAENDLFDDDSLATLNILSAQTPRAKSVGVVERIEVYYNGDKEDMTDSLRKIVNASDREMVKRSKAKTGKGYNGRVDNTMRVDGKPLELDNLVINVYITGPVSAGIGD